MNERNSRQVRKETTKYITVVILSGLIVAIIILILLDTVAQVGFSLQASIFCGVGIVIFGRIALVTLFILTKKGGRNENKA